MKTTNVAFAHELQTAAGVGAEAYAYIADGKLDTEGMQLYDDVANAGKTYGDAGTYQSAANVSACETCHGKPYMKHGYRMAAVPGLADFGGCKNCHVNGVSRPRCRLADLEGQPGACRRDRQWQRRDG